MSRPKGSLNKRTRAALHGVKTGDLVGNGMTPLEYMLKVMRDSEKSVELRLDAAKGVAPYVHARLSHVENVNLSPEDAMTEEEIQVKIQAMLQQDPDLLQKLIELTQPSANATGERRTLQ
jgi:hypothetical protein